MGRVSDGTGMERLREYSRLLLKAAFEGISKCLFRFMSLFLLFHSLGHYALCINFFNIGLCRKFFFFTSNLKLLKLLNHSETRRYFETTLCNQNH